MGCGSASAQPPALTGCIRPASGDDVAALHALEADIFGANAWSLAALAAELPPHPSADPAGATAVLRHAVVASIDDRINGYALSRHSADVCDVLRVGVSPRFRRLGLGTALVEALLNSARDEDCTRALLEVAVDNPAALWCYRRLGFTVIDRRKQYHPDGADAFVLQRFLSSLPTGQDA
jgi:[ribosomal protein S18]-alanine N-acetyltransferase